MKIADLLEYVDDSSPELAQFLAGLADGEGVADRVHEMLRQLSAVNTYDVPLKYHPEAWAIATRFLTGTAWEGKKCSPSS